MIFIFYQGEIKKHIVDEIVFTIPKKYAPTHSSGKIFSTFVQNAHAYGIVGMNKSGELSVGFISPETDTGRLYFQMFYCLNK